MSGMIPQTDDGALHWMNAYVDGIASAPTVYHVSTPNLTAMQTAVSDYSTALTTATTPSQRTKTTILAKNEKKKIAMDLCRKSGILIKYDQTISDTAKTDIGIKPPKTSHEPVNVPGTAPTMRIVGSTQGTQTLRFNGMETPDDRKKPKGASELLLFIAVTEEGTNNPDEAKFYGKVTKNPVPVIFDHDDNGKQATYFARWSSPRGELSPWSTPVSMAIAA